MALPLLTSYLLFNGGLLAVERNVKAGNWQAWDQEKERFSLISSQDVSSRERLTLGSGQLPDLGWFLVDDCEACMFKEVCDLKP